ncbi:hypothetical protein [Lachnoclostridium phytofermentans]|uniref:Uncharacterized protein n=1 Tax=Lachnoclostridium phytofermentans (strain ATCC 700394 / DSM 18823 / ISDg) TaxID=357809 RepID=A9KLY6_LACP7|nr:hypothetical protein [Lachnoclostridium phytofermentans]ABX41329.1 hypothetical protein Cphy_0947 [Lachnoclostridium phytofermentans ISDg]
MKNEKLIRSIGNVEDKFIEEAAPQHKATSKRKTLSLKRIIFRYLPIAACITILIFGTTVSAANYIQKSISSFYLRYLSPEEMAVADAMAEQYGVKVYFDALKSDDMYKQYFAINKLVEYYNDEKVRLEAIQALTPFLTNEDEKLADAAAFSLSVLKKEFNDPRIVHMADGTLIFTLFNDYSDYGSYNQIWKIKDGELSELASFERPKMYITQIIPSPDRKLFAVTFVSNKSGYLMIWDLENGITSPELIDSARIMVAKDLDYTFWQRSDYENYSGAESIEWTDNDSIEFRASLTYNGTEIVKEAIVQFNFRQKQMEYNIIK